MAKGTGQRGRNNGGECEDKKLSFWGEGSAEH